MRLTRLSVKHIFQRASIDTRAYVYSSRNINNTIRFHIHFDHPRLGFHCNRWGPCVAIHLEARLRPLPGKDPRLLPSLRAETHRLAVIPVNFLWHCVPTRATQPTVPQVGVRAANEVEVYDILSRSCKWDERRSTRMRAASGGECVVHHARLGRAVRGAVRAERGRARRAFLHEGARAAAILISRLPLSVPHLLPGEHPSLQHLGINHGHVCLVRFADLQLIRRGQAHVLRHVRERIWKTSRLRPIVVKVHSTHERTGALVIEDVVVFEPLKERLAVHNRRRGMIPDVEATRYAVAAVAVRRAAIAVAGRVTRRLLLAVIQLTAVRFVHRVALAAVPRTLWFELDVPIRVRRIFERFAHRSVPRVRPHASSVDPDCLAEARRRRHLDLVLQHDFVHHRALLRPDRLPVRPVKVDNGPAHRARRIRVTRVVARHDDRRLIHLVRSLGVRQQRG